MEEAVVGPCICSSIIRLSQPRRSSCNQKCEGLAGMGRECAAGGSQQIMSSVGAVEVVAEVADQCQLTRVISLAMMRRHQWGDEGYLSSMSHLCGGGTWQVASGQHKRRLENKGSCGLARGALVGVGTSDSPCLAPRLQAHTF